LKRPTKEETTKVRKKKIEVAKLEVEGPTKRNSKVQSKKPNRKDLQKKSPKEKSLQKKSRPTLKNLQKKMGEKKKKCWLIEYPPNLIRLLYQKSIFG